MTSHYPLSHAQRRLWAIDRMLPHSSAFDIGGAFLLTGALDAARLERAFRGLIERHEVLRTSFRDDGGAPRQVVHDAVPFALDVADLRGLADPEGAAWREAASPAPFDLASAPLFRVKLLRVGEERHVLLFRMHHIVGDAWSLDVLLSDLEALYAGRPLAAPPLQYKDFAVWEEQAERAGAWDSSRAYWAERLAGALPRVDLPSDRPRPAARSGRGGSVPFAFGGELSRRVAELNRRHGVTPFMTLLAAAATLFHRLTGQRELIVGSVTSGRDRAELERIAGCFVNLVPLRLDAGPDDSFAALLARVRREVIGALQHAAYPFDRLVRDVRDPGGAGRAPLFDVGVSWNDIGHARDEFADCLLGPFGPDRAIAEYDLLVIAGETADGIAGGIEFAADLFDRETVEAFARQLLRIVEQAAAGDARALLDFELEEDDAGAPELPVHIELRLGEEIDEIETR